MIYNLKESIEYRRLVATITLYLHGWHYFYPNYMERGEILFSWLLTSEDKKKLAGYRLKDSLPASANFTGFGYDIQQISGFTGIPFRVLETAFMEVITHEYSTRSFRLTV